MNQAARLANVAPMAEAATPHALAFQRSFTYLLLFAAAGIPLSLLWDFSWESSIGIDLVWAPPHTATYVAVAVAGFVALGLVLTTRPTCGVRLGRFEAPLGAWVAGWGALMFLVTVFFDRWWQSVYGLAAGIWHPPQILKAIAFFSVIAGAWLLCLRWQNQLSRENAAGGALAFASCGGLMLSLTTVVMLTWIYPNRQHAPAFYRMACGTYPVVLVALATAGKLQWPATVASIIYTVVICSMIWLLPLFPAKPQAAPIYNPLDHLMPPPFPLLLIVPAVALDVLFRKVKWPTHRARTWFQAGVAGLLFLVIFMGTQWLFAEFLLTDLADNWFFAGGGRHWPFFLKIDSLARVTFWETRPNEMNLLSALGAAGLAMLAAGVGLWTGAWMKRVRR